MKTEFCRFDAQGICRYGDWCRFKHVQRGHFVLEAPTAKDRTVDAAPIMFGAIEPAPRPNAQPSHAAAQQQTPTTSPQLLQPNQESKPSSSPPQPTQVQKALPTAQQSQSRVERKRPDENKYPPDQLPARTTLATVQSEQQQGLTPQQEAEIMRQWKQEIAAGTKAMAEASIAARLKMENDEEELARMEEEAVRDGVLRVPVECAKCGAMMNEHCACDETKQQMEQASLAARNKIREDEIAEHERAQLETRATREAVLISLGKCPKCCALLEFCSCNKCQSCWAVPEKCTCEL